MTLLPTLALNTSVRLSTGELDENRAIDVIGGWFSMGHRLDKESGRKWLQTTLEEGLRKGEYELTICAIEEAKAGNEIADAALRTVAREMLGDALPERKVGHVQVRAYGQRALDQPPHKRPQGRNRHDNLVRNIQICCLRHLGLSRIRRAANPQPRGTPGRSTLWQPRPIGHQPRREGARPPRQPSSQ